MKILTVRGEIQHSQHLRRIHSTLKIQTQRSTQTLFHTDLSVLHTTSLHLADPLLLSLTHTHTHTRTHTHIWAVLIVCVCVCVCVCRIERLSAALCSKEQVIRELTEEKTELRQRVRHMEEQLQQLSVSLLQRERDAQVCLHTHTHTHTLLHARTQTDRQTDRHTLLHTHSYTHTHTHTHTYRQTHNLTHTHTHTHSYTHARTHTDRQTDRHTFLHTHSYTHIHTHRQTHTLTHTHTHIYIYFIWFHITSQSSLGIKFFWIFQQIKTDQHIVMNSTVLRV